MSEARREATVKECFAECADPDTADIVEMDSIYRAGYGHSVTVLTDSDLDALRDGKVLALNSMDEYTIFVRLK